LYTPLSVSCKSSTLADTPNVSGSKVAHTTNFFADAGSVR
jgi:hypothetical protein